MDDVLRGLLADRCCTPLAPPPAIGSRRRRLWELEAHALCPLIGVCLPIAVLRRLVDKAFGEQLGADDHALHCGVITECRSRSALAERVNKALDARYALALQRAGRLKDEAALADWWRAHSDGGELPGAFWALLTHPRCTPDLAQRVLGEVHMLQHQVGMATRVDGRRLQALAEENAVLGRQLAQVQARTAQQGAGHAQELAALQRCIVGLRAQIMLGTTETQGLRAQLDQLQRAAPSLPARQALAAENQALRVRVIELQRRNTSLEDDLARQRVSLRHRFEAKARVAPHVPVDVPVDAPVDARAFAQDLAAASPAPQARLERAVLCVGGRTASVPAYRELIEGSGGRFLHHDGGDEDSAARLDATLAAADLVICQTGCISHDAYWRVKDHCKRTGKRCVFVESPSRHALARALAQVEPAARAADAHA